MNILIVTTEISLEELQILAKEIYGNMVKGAIDISKEVIAFGGEYHADAEAKLLESGSLQEDIWGFNLYPEYPEEQWIEYTALINVRPRQGNTSHEIKEERIRRKVKNTISKKVKKL